MNNYALIDNKLISYYEKVGVAARENNVPLKGALRTIKIIKGEDQVYVNGTGGIYGRKFSFDIPREYNNLQHINIKSILTATGIPTPKVYFGARIFSEIVLRTKNGTVLMMITPYYTYSRIDGLKSTQLYNHLENAVMPLTTWNNSVAEVFTPLFGWFNNYPLETMYLEPLELLVTVSDSADAMGLAADVTASSYELHLTYMDRMYNPLGNPSKEILIYDSYLEPEPVVCASGSTSKSFILTCPFPVFATHFVLSSSSQNMASISRVLVESRGVVLLDTDRRINYSLEEDIDETADVESGPFNLWWSRERSRKVPSGIMYFHQSMYPVQVTCYFSSLGGVYNLITVHEYFSNLKISDKGICVRTLPGYLEANV